MYVGCKAYCAVNAPFIERIKKQTENGNSELRQTDTA
ncbi:hypothetical protein Desgi_0621 [Desulfoscipio gibsoniae DSM 7213]|uniref:Uncharacterized protein n=1 Tax=Desulfoscipio gibsoniae DSM 7213 TaxID=767817 RepID=R4KC84_9FIRM|nr:hypothetical protein Desgi_0621 [Desulfoscipio gibsoniae DSM 7213]